jgi:uncharacterized lipoprotein YmbA
MAVIGLAALLAACAVSPPPRFYALAPVVPPAAPAERPPSIAVGPVVVAEYLKRPQIVTRLSETELELADFDQWVEPFDVLFPRVLAQDIAAALGTERVSFTPVPRDVRVDHLVEVDLIRFDATDGQGVMLDALWRVYGRDGDRLVEQSRTTVTRELPVAPDGQVAYADIVQAMSAATGDLAAAIADAVRSGTRR